MSTDASNIKYDFGYGVNFRYQVFSASDIDTEAQDRPGWYGWYIRPSKTLDRSLDFSRYAEIFCSKALEVTASAPLKELYRGKVKRELDTSTLCSSTNSYMDEVSSVFCPPIYIGISKRIKQRLTNHVRALNDVLYGSSESTQIDQSTGDDSEEESRFFGQRIGNLLQANGFKSSDVLYVKVVYQDKYDPSELRAAEYFVNRTFLPLCGRL